MSTHPKVIARTDSHTSRHTHTDTTKTLPLPHTREVTNRKKHGLLFNYYNISTVRPIEFDPKNPESVPIPVGSIHEYARPCVFLLMRVSLTV